MHRSPGTRFRARWILVALGVAGALSPARLASALDLEKSTLSRNLRPLIDKGWVLQGPGADGRSRCITITPDGAAKHAEARRHWKRAQQALNARLGGARVVHLHAMMDSVQAALQGD